MANVTFKFDAGMDAFNYWESANATCEWKDFKGMMNPEILAAAKNKDFKSCKHKILRILKHIHSSDFIPLTIDSFDSGWKLIGKEFFKRLEKLTGKPIYTDKFTAYVTTFGRCSYDKNKDWFMTCFFAPVAGSCLISAHELMHLQFHHYWEKGLVKRIGKKKFEDIKEALTILLDIEFKDILLVKDRGYECHTELREFIRREWKKEKDFEKLIEKLVKHVK